MITYQSARAAESRDIVGVDTGGTFTDLVEMDANGEIRHSIKVSTTPEDPSRGILEAFGTVGTREISAFLHGTTTGTNALLERQGARVALLTTRGFRDVLEIARQGRPSLYDWFDRKPDLLVRRELTFEIDERNGPHPAGRRPMDEAQAGEVIERLRGLDVDAVAVSLLHAYNEPDNEVRLGELLSDALPGVHVSLSSDVLPEIMEYERTCATAANAYLSPVVQGYLERLLGGLESAGLPAPVYVMQSNGGLASAATISRRAVQTVLSGPAAGVIGGLASATGSSKSGFLTIDMGGTSFDVAYAEGRAPTISRESVIDGLPLAVPALDIHTLGAGGGSIAWIDRGGALRVGPQSAGSQPGPACYGRGGDEPTVTDANVVLGRLGAQLLGGRLPLDVPAARRAIERHVAQPLGLSVPDAARGIIDVVNAAMAKGMHLMSVARGRDPRMLGVIGFGGAGPLHACELAELTGSDEVIIPVLPGNTSALGLALADVRRERSRSVIEPVSSVSDADARKLLDELGEEVLSDLADDGVASGDVVLQAFARISHEGQRYQLQVPLDHGGPWTAGSSFGGSLAAAPEAFGQRHVATYGYSRSEPLDLFSLDVVGIARMTSAASPRLKAVDGRSAGNEAARRTICFSSGAFEAAVHARESLSPGVAFTGPAVIEQADTTTLVPPGWQGEADRFGNLILRRSVT